jgi:peptidoglycan/xylan/chitin deacetylase (PgdA/CDA1 family)
MERRRFLAIGATAAVILAGCSRFLREDEARPSDAPTGRARSTDEPSSSDEPTEPEVEVEEPGEVAEAGPEGSDPETDPATSERPDVDPDLLTTTPQEWGEAVTGVGRRLADTSAVALTLDACGGPNGSGYDAGLIEHLRRHEVPATLFMNARWVEANRSTFDDLAADPLFEIANHGTEHRPLSVDGRSVYGITGTASAEAVIDEVWECQRLLTELTGTAPRFFRSGTAYYDDVAVRIVHDLGLEVAGYSVLGDAGATFSAAQVRDALTRADPGSIVLLHMNHPASGTADGVASALPDLLERGATFTTLGRHTLT